MPACGAAERPRTTHAMANIYDVARHARVSVATVSAVVNGTAFVTRALRDRVETAIEKLGYHPNLLARSLAKRQSHTIGMIVPDIANPFFPEVIRGVEDAAHAAGYSVLLANGDNDPAKEELYLSLFLAKRVDGLLLTKGPGRMPREVIARLKATEISVVQLARTIPGFRSDAVLMDDWGAGYEAVSHLLRMGRRRIGMITGLPDVSTTKQRLAGYRQALEDFGHQVDDELIMEGDFRVHSGYAAGLDLLKKRPDAVFISNYLMSVGFIKVLRQYQLRCPEDVAIVTCDDHPWLDAFSPRLTTIDLPKRDLGAEAARVLIARIARRKGKYRTVQLKSSMCIRESCGYELARSRPDATRPPGEFPATPPSQAVAGPERSDDRRAT